MARVEPMSKGWSYLPLMQKTVFVNPLGPVLIKYIAILQPTMCALPECVCRVEIRWAWQNDLSASEIANATPLVVYVVQRVASY